MDVTLRRWTAVADFFGTRTDLAKAARLAFDPKGIAIAGSAEAAQAA